MIFSNFSIESKGDSWLMFRTSGTEPLVRIYSEAANAARVTKLLELGQSLAIKRPG